MNASAAQTDSAATMTRLGPATTITTLLTRMLTSTVLARVVVVGLPLLSVFAAVTAEVTWLAVLLTAGFLGAAVIVCGRAALTFAGQTLRLLLAARLAIAVVIVAVLFATHGFPHDMIVSGAMSWLVADRLVGGRALVDLWRLVAKRG